MVGKGGHMTDLLTDSTHNVAKEKRRDDDDDEEDEMLES